MAIQETTSVTLNVSDGRKRYLINGDENRAFYVNLTDDNILVRAKKAQERLKNLEIDSDMDEIDAIEFANNEAYKQFDYIFNGEVSKAVFGLISPFAVVDRKTGQTFWENFMEAVMPEIEKDMAELKKSLEESEKRIKKYTNKYRK